MHHFAHRRAALAALVAAGMLAGLAGASWAVGSAGPDDRAGAGRSAPAPKIVGVTHGGVCKGGYDTETSTNIPPDDSTADNPPAGSVTFTKCNGAVIGTFTSEVSAPNAGDFIHIDMRATCLGSGGQTNPCTTGQQVFGSPGHTFFENGAVAYGTHAMQMVWTGLAPGKWLFEVLPGGNNSANMQYRTFRVDAFQGG